MAAGQASRASNGLGSVADAADSHIIALPMTGIVCTFAYCVKMRFRFCADRVFWQASPDRLGSSIAYVQDRGCPDTKRTHHDGQTSPVNCQAPTGTEPPIRRGHIRRRHTTHADTINSICSRGRHMSRSDVSKLRAGYAKRTYEPGCLPACALKMPPISDPAYGIWHTRDTLCAMNPYCV